MGRQKQERKPAPIRKDAVELTSARTSRCHHIHYRPLRSRNGRALFLQFLEEDLIEQIS